jgi:hypothetical protein
MASLKRKVYDVYPPLPRGPPLGWVGPSLRPRPPRIYIPSRRYRPPSEDAFAEGALVAAAVAAAATAAAQAAQDSD